MINNLIELIVNFAHTVPLEVFAFVGSVIEELVAPIPSPMIMTLAGSIAKAQNHHFMFLLWIALFASLAKTAMGYLYYILGDKSEDIVLKRYGKYIGVSHKEVESIGRHFNGTLKDDIIIFLLRAIPVLPTSIISFALSPTPSKLAASLSVRSAHVFNFAPTLIEPWAPLDS